MLTLHEMVNDTVGDVPIAVSYSALCDSVVVFDRRIDGAEVPPVEFGNSGLLVSSNAVYYDRRAGGAGVAVAATGACGRWRGPMRGRR